MKKKKIYILDSGIDVSCNDIRNAIYVNRKEIPDNNIDDDKNGYIDDRNGWNFYDNNSSVFTNYVSDYHGTMIAGIIAGEHKRKQAYGIAPNVKILPLKCFRGTEGSVEDVSKAISYAYNLGVRIFNCSWDTVNYYDDLLKTIKEYDDAVFICSGGKQGMDLGKNPVYPACYKVDNVLCVGAVNNAGKLYSYSGYGKEVDIYAPGENVLCLLPENEHMYSEGTSLATAFVTGAVALLKSAYPNVELKQIMEGIVSHSKEIENIKILNVENTLKNIKCVDGK